MAAATYDVLGIGNAIVDILAKADDDFLVKHGMTKGAMALIDEERATAVYKAMGPATEISGGSAANTIAGLASFGARAAFIGKVRDDQLGAVFAHDIKAANVAFETAAAKSGAATARSFILVSPDGERTMNTFLGAAQDLSPADIDPAQIAAASVIYLEGYLWDPKDAKDAFLKASKVAHDNKRTVALTLSDAFCVGRYRDEFLNLVKTRTVDLVFANEAELTSLYQTGDFDEAIAQLRNDASLAVVTRSEKGCVVAAKDKVTAVPAFPVKQVVDTTGAGDLFAAGFLFGTVRSMTHEQSGRLGALAAAEVIQHIGARPQTSLKALAQSQGLPV